MTTPTHTSRSIHVLEDGDQIFFTLTMDDPMQHRTHPKKSKRQTALNFRSLIKKRHNKVLQDFEYNLSTFYNLVFKEYKTVYEISQPLSSKKRYYPRIHFHSIATIDNVSTFLHALEPIFSMGYGYDIQYIDSIEYFEKKALYIKKQAKTNKIFFQEFCNNRKTFRLLMEKKS